MVRGLLNKALIENINFNEKTHRISVRTVTQQGLSHDQQCTLLLTNSKEFADQPMDLRVDRITATTATVSWWPASNQITHKLYVNDVEVQTLKSIKEQTGWYNDVEFKSSNGCDRIVCEAFDGTPISIDVTGLPDDTIVYYSSDSGDEPSWDEDSGEYNYDDVDLDWFTEEAQEAAKFVYLPFMEGEYTYGGGFNG